MLMYINWNDKQKKKYIYGFVYKGIQSLALLNMMNGLKRFKYWFEMFYWNSEETFKVNSTFQENVLQDFQGKDHMIIG